MTEGYTYPITALALASLIREAASNKPRFIVALAGPPAAGKSTWSEKLCQELQAQGETAAVMPMDGFHYDDAVLEKRGQRARKGADFTFDALGFGFMLTRLRKGEGDVAIPLFDRNLELSRAGADVISNFTRFILVEGNYLLLDKEPWRDFYAHYDYRIFIDVPAQILEQRLIARWVALGFSAEIAKERVLSNDLVNMQNIQTHRLTADLVI